MMSRHQIAAHTPGITVAVGWDNPLQTFFALVTDDNAEADDDVLLWLGGFHQEIRHARDLIEPLAPYATLDDTSIRQLQIDRAACILQPLTALQRALISLVQKPH